MHRQAFDVDRVTKRFYDRFKSEHVIFLQFIKGMASTTDREWYASLMLNRLMFIYFIQKKGFLDNDIHYLPNRLGMMQERKGKDTFLSFLRHFLLRLFHEGLDKQKHTVELDALLGRVPYLNGGLFDNHELERNNPDIQIPDEAFQRIFTFFDAYQWHLDDCPLRSDNEINPDVLGYIFEKYNNQKQMGAYYTKEDITGYISENTIIPFLFINATEQCISAFQPGSRLWRLLKDDPNRYIYNALKKGCELPLPPDIAAGLHDVSQRTEWNKPAPEAYALPTEIWREVVARRKRYEEIYSKLQATEISSINDLITYNLNIRQFAHDVIKNSEGPELLHAFYTSISRVTVLDPTCGSGAFLLAALNVLEPLYEACLDRMQAMVSDYDRPLDYVEPHNRSILQQSLPDFRAILQQIEQHPNRRYFILKSIIVNNLYGVDIMEEATEICKLRLFLKLVAQIERVEDIEPLPDLDFNIRAGNTLVGFASHDEVRNAITRKFDFDKENLRGQQCHQPFHWFVEFYGIMKSGGFDVIIGNPPYVAYSKVRNNYQIQHYLTESSSNLFAFTMERSLHLLRQGGYLGMIVPVSSISGESYKPLIDMFLQRHVWLSSYANRPAKLFAGVEQRLSIFIVKNTRTPGLFTTPYQHWYEPERDTLFHRLSYTRASLWAYNGMPLKSGSSEAETIFTRLTRHDSLLSTRTRSNRCALWVHDGPTYWVRALSLEPNVGMKSERSNHYHKISVASYNEALVLTSLFSSSTFYLFFKLVSNCRDLGQKEWATFPFGRPTSEIIKALTILGNSLEKRLQVTAATRTRRYPGGVIEYEEYYPAKAKPIIDEIDRVLAQHYGFTGEELDFIINYNIKYRMERDNDDESED